MAILFVSDLHLSAERPGQLDRFLSFAERARSCAQALYILGDLFEVWLGDDDDTPPHPEVLQALEQVSAAGVELAVGHGNRDFLFGRRFERATGAKLMADYEIIDLFGQRTLLTHGDLLCTKDVKYQKFRKLVRNPLVRSVFLGAPLGLRRRIALKTQSGTKASMRTKPEDIMDVDEATVAEVMAAYGVTLLIHGHTHRPATHDLDVDGKACRRIVLGDWYEQDSVLFCDGDGPRAMRVSEFLE
jgi:UDP-2,3-diacylglucosamine hydrolase